MFCNPRPSTQACQATISRVSEGFYGSIARISPNITACSAIVLGTGIAALNNLYPYNDGIIAFAAVTVLHLALLNVTNRYELLRTLSVLGLASALAISYKYAVSEASDYEISPNTSEMAYTGAIFASLLYLFQRQLSRRQEKFVTKPYFLLSKSIQTQLMLIATLLNYFWSQSASDPSLQTLGNSIELSKIIIYPSAIVFLQDLLFNLIHLKRATSNNEQTSKVSSFRSNLILAFIFVPAISLMLIAIAVPAYSRGINIIVLLFNNLSSLSGYIDLSDSYFNPQKLAYNVNILTPIAIISLFLSMSKEFFEPAVYISIFPPSDKTKETVLEEAQSFDIFGNAVTQSCKKVRQGHQAPPGKWSVRFKNSKHTLMIHKNFIVSFLKVQGSVAVIANILASLFALDKHFSYKAPNLSLSLGLFGALAGFYPYLQKDTEWKALRRLASIAYQLTLLADIGKNTLILGTYLWLIWVEITQETQAMENDAYMQLLKHSTSLLFGVTAAIILQQTAFSYHISHRVNEEGYSLVSEDEINHAAIMGAKLASRLRFSSSPKPVSQNAGSQQAAGVELMTVVNPLRVASGQEKEGSSNMQAQEWA
jgi:hypothetical protein